MYTQLKKFIGVIVSNLQSIFLITLFDRIILFKLTRLSFDSNLSFANSNSFNYYV